MRVIYLNQKNDWNSYLFLFLGKAPKTVRPKKPKKKRHPDDTSEEESDASDEENPEDNLSDSAKAELFRLREERKDFLVSNSNPGSLTTCNLQLRVSFKSLSLLLLLS